MEKALNGIAALNEGFRCIIDDHLREYQRTHDAEQENRLQQLEDRILELLRSQLDRKLADVRRELWDHVDERHRVAKALQEESEQGLLHSFQDRAAQLHKQWTLEQEAASTGLRRLGEDLREELNVHMDQELERLSQRMVQKQRQEIEAKFDEDRQQREAQMSQIRAELQDVRLTISASVANITSPVPVAAPGVPAATTPAAAASGAGGATGVPPDEDAGAAAGAAECPAAAVDATASAPGSSSCPGDATGVPLVVQAPGAEVGSDQGVEVGHKSTQWRSAAWGGGGSDVAGPTLRITSQSTEMVAVEDAAHASGSAVSEQAIMPQNLLSPETMEDLDTVLLAPLSSPANLRGPEEFHSADSSSQARVKQRPPLLGTRGRVIVVLGIILIMAFLCTFLFMKPFITLYIVAVSLVWIIFLLGEEPMVRMINSKAEKYRSEFCKKKLKMFAACLKRVQNARSSHDKEQQSMVLLYSLSVLGISWNPDATNMIGYLLATFNPALIFPILGLQFLLCCWLARKLVSYLHSPTLRRPIHGTVDHPAVSAAATEALQTIQDNLKATAGSRRHRQAETTIREIFQDCDQEMLNELLAEMSHSNACSLGDVILFFQDQEAWKARSEFLKLLCEERSSDLSVRSKSVVLDALMLMKLSSCEYGESAVGSLLESACGDELSELKSIQDAGNVHSIHKLVFQDVTSREIRDRIVYHFLHEGIAQVAHRTLMANSHFCKLLDMSKRCNILPDSLGFLQQQNGEVPGEPYYHGCNAGHRWLKIFTDIDDTLECSGGRWPAGIDTRYPKHLPYPGATAFYRVLQGGGDVGQLVALSARPHLVGTVMEESVIRKFADLREKHGLHCMPALLTGAIDAGGTFLLSGGDDNGMAALGQKKLEKIMEYIRLYPEFRIVFVGDNGQADFAVGDWVCEKFPQYVEQVWIHEVQKRENTFRYEAKSIENKPVAFFEDFVDAASQAASRRNPLIPPEGLLEVVKAAVSDFRKIQNWPSEEGRFNEAKRLTKSIDKARALLQDFGIIDEVVTPLIDEPQTPKTAPQDERAENPRSWWRPNKPERKQKSLTPNEKKPSSPAMSIQQNPNSPAMSPSSSPRVKPTAVERTAIAEAIPEAIPELPLPAFTSEGAEEQLDAAVGDSSARVVEAADMDASGQVSSAGRISTQVLSQFFRRPQSTESNEISESAAVVKKSNEIETAGNMEAGPQDLKASSTGYRSDAESSDAAEGGQTDSDKERNASYLSRAKEFARSATAWKSNNPSTVPEVDPIGGDSTPIREDTIAAVTGAETQVVAESTFCSVPEGLSELAPEAVENTEVPVSSPPPGDSTPRPGDATPGGTGNDAQRRSIISRIARKMIDSSPTPPEQASSMPSDAPGTVSEEAADGSAATSTGKAAPAEPPPQAHAPAAAEVPLPGASVDVPSGMVDSSSQLQQPGNKRSLFSRLRSGASKQSGKEREVSAGALEPLPERSSSEERPAGPAAEEVAVSDQTTPPGEPSEAARGSRETHPRVNPCSSFLSLTSLQEGSEEAEEVEENQSEDPGNQEVAGKEVEPLDEGVAEGHVQTLEEGKTGSEADAQGAASASSEVEQPQASESEP